MECFDAAAVAAWAATASATDNCGGTMTVTPSYTAPTSNCNQTVTVTFTSVDACGNTGTTTKNFTVDDNTAPSVTCQNMTVQLGIGGTVSIDPEDIEATSSDNCGTVNLTLDKSTFDCNDVGDNLVTLTATDACGNTSTCTATVTVQVPTQTKALVSAQSVRYQDEVTLYAEISASNCNISSGNLQGNVKFYLDGDSVGIAPAFPIPFNEAGYPTKLRATLIYKVKKLPKVNYETNPYEVTARFFSDTDNYLDSEDDTSLIVRPRPADAYDAKGYYTGDVFAWTTGPNSSRGTLTMVATIKDRNTPDGDVRGAKVTFCYVNNGVLTPIPSAQNLPVGLVNPTDGSLGYASAIVQFDIGTQNAQNYQVAVKITGGYENDPYCGISQCILTVSKPLTGGYICGGSRLINSAHPDSLSSGYIRGASGLCTDYQFDIQYTKSGTNPKGKVKIMVNSYYKRDGTLDNKLHTYIITTNAIASLNVGAPSATGTFSAKANLVEQFPDSIVAIEGGSTFQMVAYQNGCDQRLAITLHRKLGGIWFSSSWKGTNTVQRQVASGSKVYVSGATTTCLPAAPITSSGNGGMKSTAEAEERPVTVMPLSAKAFPNPSEKDFNLFVEGGNTKDEVQITVYNTNGAIVHTARGTSNRNYKFGDSWIGGMYFVQVRQGKELKTLQLMKQ
jgi:hypothetical protein